MIPQTNSQISWNPRIALKRRPLEDIILITRDLSFMSYLKIQWQVSPLLSL